MRLLASCSACKRQYDARGLKPAQHFRCSCGTLVTVAAPTSAVLAVAHCGTCGAARTTTSRVCAFCKATFSDLDLRRDTMCPGCYGHIASSAKYCDHCGLGIQPTRVAGKASLLACPVCSGVTLRTRHLPEADHPIDECARCGGAWLEMAIFDRVVDRARTQATTAQPTKVRTLPTQNGPLYRSCPVCREMMNRRNYGGSSAVIIDACKAHGVWFDAQELGHIVAWIRAGGFDRQRQQERDEEDRKRRVRESAQRNLLPTDGPPSETSECEVLFDLGFEALSQVVGGIFRRL